MGFRFRRSINLGGGFKINLSKSGIGYSWGTKDIALVGLHVGPRAGHIPFPEQESLMSMNQEAAIGTGIRPIVVIRIGFRSIRSGRFRNRLITKHQYVR